jgi:hypothetical protein
MGSVSVAGLEEAQHFGALRELGMFDWLGHVQASPLTYLVVVGACVDGVP